MTVRMQADCPSPKGELLRESRWARTYRFGGGTLFESKFDWDEAEISREEIERLWSNLSPAERLEFSTAYGFKPKVTAEDEKVLDFLMEAGDENVCGMIALLLTRHSNRERVVNFLLERATSPSPLAANYYQALEVIGDVRAIPVLQRSREIHLKNIEGGSTDEVRDYLVGCRTLWKLTGSEDYAAEIRKAMESADPAVSAHAKRLLEDQ